jgi:hypothetical protein
MRHGFVSLRNTCPRRPRGDPDADQVPTLETQTGSATGADLPASGSFECTGLVYGHNTRCPEVQKARRHSDGRGHSALLKGLTIVLNLLKWLHPQRLLASFGDYAISQNVGLTGSGVGHLKPPNYGGQTSAESEGILVY